MSNRMRFFPDLISQPKEVTHNEQQPTPKPDTPAKTAEIPVVTEGNAKRQLFADQTIEHTTADNTNQNSNLPAQTQPAAQTTITDTAENNTKRPLSNDEVDPSHPSKKLQEDTEATQP